MNKKISIFLILIIVSYYNCKNSTNSIPPTSPNWIDISVDFDSLPGYLVPSELTYTVNITGIDASYVISNRGDTLDNLWLKFNTSDWCEGLNSDADSIWCNKIKIGDEIILKPTFQILRDETQLWSHISLYWRYYDDNIENPKDSIEFPMGVFSLSFNHHTGEYDIE